MFHNYRMVQLVTKAGGGNEEELSTLTDEHRQKATSTLSPKQNASLWVCWWMRKPSSPGNRRQAVLREAHSRMNIILVSSSDRLWLSSSRRWRCYQIIMLFTSGAEKGNFQASTFMRVENFRAVRCAEGDAAECEPVGCIMFAQTIQLAFCFPPATCVHIIQGLISNKKALSPDSHRSGADRRRFGSEARNSFQLALAACFRKLQRIKYKFVQEN